jgi:hypothetical protein
MSDKLTSTSRIERSGYNINNERSEPTTLKGKKIEKEVNAATTARKMLD